MGERVAVGCVVVAVLVLPTSAVAQTYGGGSRSGGWVAVDPTPPPGSCAIELPPMSDLEMLRFGGDHAARCDFYVRERAAADARAAAAAEAEDRARRDRDELVTSNDPVLVGVFIALGGRLGDSRVRYESAARPPGVVAPDAAGRARIVYSVVDFVVREFVAEAAARSGVLGAEDAWREDIGPVDDASTARRADRHLRAYERELSALLDNVRADLSVGGAGEMAALLGCARLSVVAARDVVRLARHAARGRHVDDFAQAVARSLPTCSTPDATAALLATELVAAAGSSCGSDCAATTSPP